MANNGYRSRQEGDLIPEIAQLIRRETASEGRDQAPPLPPTPQLPADVSEQAHEFDECPHDGGAYDAGNPPFAADEDYQTETPRVRRRGPALVIAMTGLALLGTAGVLGYREIFGGSIVATSPPIITANHQPNKIVPVSGPSQAKNSGNARQDDVDTTGSIGKLVSREEQPVTIEPPKGTTSRVGTPPALTPITAGQPIPDQIGAQVFAAAAAKGSPPNADASQHLAAIPTTPAAVTSPILGSGYAVQVTSERSESGAQAVFRALQAKYPNQLGGREATIRRADLGAGGIYYRALVGPLTSATEAKRLCSKLKAAGADCIIQKN